MPMPWTYRQASREWQAFLEDAKEAMGLTSDNACYTAVEGVLRAFRRRLEVQEALDFAQVLPAVLRALVVADWQIGPAVAAGTRADWTAAAKALRRHHNLTPDTCVEATALALRKSVLPEDMARVLGRLPAFAAEFWAVPGGDPSRLGPRIV
jgi:uncharacterized protein (DUF2267 family)